MPAFPGAVVADKSFNGVPEWALGVTSWFEAGLYLPLYSRDKTSGFGLDGFKLRALFAVPNADDRKFFYGANFEFSINAHRWDTTRFTSEVRPIIGWHLKPVDIIINPIVDTPTRPEQPRFIMTTRHNFPLGWTAAVGMRDRMITPSPARRRRTSYAASSIAPGRAGYRGGVGLGLTDASDRLTLKLILARDLNKRPVTR